MGGGQRARLPAAITHGSRRLGVGVRRERRGARSFRAALPRWDRYGFALSPTCPACSHRGDDA
eukprot:5538196-Prymnesium_polylepis.2